MTCENCQKWREEVKRLQNAKHQLPPETAEPATGDEIIKNLIAHQWTHTDWATWFEIHPDDPRIAAVGTAEFHRDVEARYSRMIAGVRILSRAANDGMEDQIIEERDTAEKAISDAYRLVMKQEPEWSNLFGFDAALDDIGERVKRLESINAELVEALGKIIEIDDEGGISFKLPSIEHALEIGRQTLDRAKAK